jgi:hypothetical protein
MISGMTCVMPQAWITESRTPIPWRTTSSFSTRSALKGVPGAICLARAWSALRSAASSPMTRSVKGAAWRKASRAVKATDAVSVDEVGRVVIGLRAPG